MHRTGVADAAPLATGLVIVAGEVLSVSMVVVVVV